MLDESRNGRVSREPVKQGSEELQGRRKLKSPRSRANGSDHESDAPSDGNSRSKPQSPPTGLQKKSKDANASDDTFVVEVDPSTKIVTLNFNLPIFGTKNQDSIRALVNQVGNVVTDVAGKRDPENLKYALPTIYGIGPKDELEGLLAVQMMGVHNLAVQCLMRASLEGQTTEGMDTNINRATKLMRTFTAQMEALNRHRGKINQSTVVGNVNVNDGGQAIVGSVSHDSRGKPASEDDADKVS